MSVRDTSASAKCQVFNYTVIYNSSCQHINILSPLVRWPHPFLVLMIRVFCYDTAWLIHQHYWSFQTMSFGSHLFSLFYYKGHWFFCFYHYYLFLQMMGLNSIMLLTPFNCDSICTLFPAYKSVLESRFSLICHIITFSKIFRMFELTSGNWGTR